MPKAERRVKILTRVRNLFRRDKLDGEMVEEMRHHVELQTELNIKAGMNPDEARFAALRQFGNVARVQEQVRGGRGWVRLERTLWDFCFAVRRMRKVPGFTAVSLLTLALCIGANTTIFSIAYALLLKPLPFPEPARIVGIRNVFDSRSMDSSLVQYTDYKANAVSYDAVGLWRLKGITGGDVGSEERITAAACTAEMFEVFGVKPLLGQFFTLENNRLGEEHVVVLTQSFWEAHFNSDPGVLGKILRVDGESSRIIGVAPRELEAFDTRARLIIPLPWKPSWIKPTDRYYLDTPLYGRLKRGISTGQAQAEAATIEKRFYDAAPEWNKKILDQSSYRIAVTPVQADRAGSFKASVYLLQGGVLFVLIIGCVNVANLLLTRTNGRHGELSLRLALGATRGALTRQLLVEGLVLALSGAALGVGGAFGAVRLINQFSEKMLPGLQPFAIDGYALGFTVAITLAVGLLISLLPMMRVGRPDLLTLINRTTRNASAGRGARVISGILVTGQIAVTLILLTGAGLLIHSFVNAAAINPGFEPTNLMTARIALGRSYWNEHGAVFQQQLVQALKEIPAVSDVALASGVPYEGGLDSRILTLKDSPLPSGALQPKAFEVGISPGYFETLHIRLLAGRFLNEYDIDGREYVVDERFAQTYFPGRSAVGAHFTFMNRNLPAKTEDWPVIVGVVQNIAHNGVEKSDTPFSYYPVLKTQPEELNLFVRSSRPLGDLVASIREKLHALDPGIPLYHIEEMQTAIDESYDDRRAVMLLLGSFAALALFLAAVGLYGFLAFDVSMRTKEIGVRSALGASSGQIVNLIMRQALWWTGIGLVAGLIGAVLLSQLMSRMLFALKPSDPWAYTSVSLLFVAIAGLATYLPARRAARVDPVIALRAE